MPESAGARASRWLTLFSSHPIRWSRYLWTAELRHREVRFETNPRFVDWGPMWRVARRPLARTLGRAPESLDPFYAELAPLHAALLAEAGPMPSAGAMMQAPLLYVLVRAVRPNWIVETGISTGLSARLLLEALRQNDAGRLDSIGIDEFGIAYHRSADGERLKGRHVGWLVPPSLQDRWGLHIGPSQQLLPKLLTEAGRPLDLFLHDSRHNYETMRWEYATAWPHVPPGGLIASHDVHTTRAWPEFVAAHGLSASSAELDHDLGVARRPTGPASGTSPRPASG